MSKRTPSAFRLASDRLLGQTPVSEPVKMRFGPSLSNRSTTRSGSSSPAICAPSLWSAPKTSYWAAVYWTKAAARDSQQTGHPCSRIATIAMARKFASLADWWTRASAEPLHQTQKSVTKIQGQNSLSGHSLWIGLNLLTHLGLLAWCK